MLRLLSTLPARVYYFKPSLMKSLLSIFLCALFSVLAQAQNPQCTGRLTYTPTGNCCYDVNVSFIGATCAQEVVTDIDFNTAFGPNAADIASFTAAPGISVNVSSTTTARLTRTPSFTTLPSFPAVIGTLCLENGHPLALVNATATSASGVTLIFDNTELDGSCSPPPPPGPPVPFDKIYGGAGDDVPEDILITSRGKYLVVGNANEAPSGRGTVSLIDPASVSVLWQQTFPAEVIVSDVAEDPATGDFYVVVFDDFLAGGQLQDNQSALIKLSATGTKLWEQRFDHTGRERLWHVAFNQTAQAGGGAGVFVVGAKNPALPVSGVDYLVAHLFDVSGTALWSVEIPENDLEAYRGIVDVGFGSHVVLGNDGQGNGVIYEIQQGGFGGVRKRFNRPIDWWHGAQLPSSNYVWVGQDYQQDIGVVMVTDQSLNVLQYYEVPELEKLEQVYASNGRFYTVGQLKTDPQERNVILGLTETPNGLNIDLARRIDEGNTQRTLGRLHVLDAAQNFIGFAEALTPSPGYGQLDMHLAIYDRAISGACVTNEAVTLRQRTLSTSTLATLPQPLMTPLVSPATRLTPIGYQCRLACSTPPLTCPADFTWIDRGCGDVDYTATPQGAAPFTYAWELTGSPTVTSTAANPNYNYGLAGASVQVCLTIVDAAGCSDRVCKPVTVAPDATGPTINCPADTSLRVPICAGGATVRRAPVTATDGCDSLVMVSCTTPPNDFYPCGRTTVTCTATDRQGNVSTCSYDVVVNCDCVQEADAFMECTDTADHYYFAIELDDLSGASSCTVTNLSYAPASVVPSSVRTVYDPATGKYYIEGYFDPAPGTRFPQNVTVDIDVQCTCPNGTVHTCSQRVVIATPCCKEAFFPDTALCRDASQLLIDVAYFGTVTDVTQVNYWISYGPCTPGSLPSGQPYQSSRPYRPLLLIPSLIPSNEVCIYAEVYLGASERPCTVLRTNVATVDLCDPIGLSLPSESFCVAAGVQVQPSLLTLNLPVSSDCYDATSIEWFENGVRISGANGPSYQPPTLTNTMSGTDCSASTTYTVEIQTTCGPASASATITLDNEDADVGDLYLDPTEPLPACPGEDFTLRFDENCAGAPLPPETWRWSSREATTSYATVAGSGPENPRWNTNRLYEDTWYRVERKNGSCPVQETEFMLDVRDPLTLVTFNVKELDVCRETGARISVNFGTCPSGVCPCPVTIEYYYNDDLIHTSTSTTGADFYDFSSPASDVYCGNYYAVLRSTCCDEVIKTPVEVLGCPIDLAASGNCYCCDNGEALLLQGFPINVDAASFPCTFQWYLWDGSVWNAIVGATSAAHAPAGFGRFKLEMNCGGCIKEAEHVIKDCGCDMASGINDVRPDLDFSFFPNPASSSITVELAGSAGAIAERLELRDVRGVLLATWPVAGHTKLAVELPVLPKGDYLLSLISTDRQLFTRRLIHQ